LGPSPISPFSSFIPAFPDLPLAISLSFLYFFLLSFLSFFFRPSPVLFLHFCWVDFFNPWSFFDLTPWFSFFFQFFFSSLHLISFGLRAAHLFYCFLLSLSWPVLFPFFFIDSSSLQQQLEGGTAERQRRR
jgi:hypothetical protein